MDLATTYSQQAMVLAAIALVLALSDLILVAWALGRYNARIKAIDNATDEELLSWAKEKKEGK